MNERLERIDIDGCTYKCEVYQRLISKPNVPRIVIPAYIPNSTALSILKVCIQSIQLYTTEDSYELWVIDNCSLREYTEEIVKINGINLVLSRTEPRPPDQRTFPQCLALWRDQRLWGSYANWIGLELALRLIPAEVSYIVPMHMDVMICRDKWLTYLRSKVSGKIGAAGVYLERHRVREGVLHMMGLLIDYKIFRQLNLTLKPDLPGCDVGDLLTIGLRERKYDVYSCRNTYLEPHLLCNISSDLALRHINVVRVFDDEWKVFFLHLGRGIPKADKRYHGNTASSEDWLKFASDYVLQRKPYGALY